MFVGVAVVVGAVAIGYFGWRERVQSKAHALLAEAMVVHDARNRPAAGARARRRRVCYLPPSASGPRRR